MIIKYKKLPKSKSLLCIFSYESSKPPNNNTFKKIHLYCTVLLLNAGANKWRHYYITIIVLQSIVDSKYTCLL